MSTQLGRVRIIAGKWRSRKLKVVSGVRPSQDAYRESLFNVLGSKVINQHCLDLYAGSGALGLEALSRGAASVTFIEQSNKVIATLKKNIASLETNDAVINKSDVFTWLNKKVSKKFELVFLDPPFKECKKSNWWENILALLLPHININSIVCCEGPAPVSYPENYHSMKSGRVGAAFWTALVKQK